MTINLNDLNKYLDVAKEAALRAGIVLKERFRKLCPSMIDEKAKNDFVTEADKKSQEIIKGHIRSQFNNHDILAEESFDFGKVIPLIKRQGKGFIRPEYKDALSTYSTLS